MSRSIGERIMDPWWYAEQALHALASWPAVFAPFYAGALVGLWVGGQREWVEWRKSGAPRHDGERFDLAADLVASALGGLVWAAIF